MAQSKVALARAELDLSYTKIGAVIGGTVANLTVVAGIYVQAGHLLLSLAPNEVYVVANFKETQLTGVRPGSRAVVPVDAIGGERLRANVDGMQRGSGSRFALLPRRARPGVS